MNTFEIKEPVGFVSEPSTSVTKIRKLHGSKLVNTVTMSRYMYPPFWRVWKVTEKDTEEAKSCLDTWVELTLSLIFINWNIATHELSK